jgi:hypothetical protein
MPAFAGPVPCWCRAGMTNYDTVSVWGGGHVIVTGSLSFWTLDSGYDLPYRGYDLLPGRPG